MQLLEKAWAPRFADSPNCRKPVIVCCLSASTHQLIVRRVTLPKAWPFRLGELKSQYNLNQNSSRSDLIWSLFPANCQPRFKRRKPEVNCTIAYRLINSPIATKTLKKPSCAVSEFGWIEWKSWSRLLRKVIIIDTKTTADCQPASSMWNRRTTRAKFRLRDARKP